MLQRLLTEDVRSFQFVLLDDQLPHHESLPQSEKVFKVVERANLAALEDIKSGFLAKEEDQDASSQARSIVALPCEDECASNHKTAESEESGTNASETTNCYVAVETIKREGTPKSKKKRMKKKKNEQEAGEEWLVLEQRQ